MAKVLVTGANGHLGCNTVRALVAAGHEVRGMVREGDPRLLCTVANHRQ